MGKRLTVRDCLDRAEAAKTAAAREHWWDMARVVCREEIAAQARESNRRYQAEAWPWIVAAAVGFCLIAALAGFAP
jgi:hypothetical protein